MKIDFLVLSETIDSLGWNKAVAIVRNGFEADIISEVECQLALDKMKAMFEHYMWRWFDVEGTWEHHFYNNAFDMGKPFSLERDTGNGYYLHGVANKTKNDQSWESAGKRAIEEYTVIGENPDCIMTATKH
ncbi:hypothetical protein VPT02_004 [Vibrio phage VPT02]|uniref:Uncharacterized protein n=1 Tax=Vibrio phage pVp-1 TaxID=1150989 RepID=H6WXM0_9CAUD|nr:hypothetical protein F404_gp129 [Vibrio phage pVp-1]AFB83986.1 hypothetical protein pVp-1_0129 [Vibrio phage pVp-1]QIG60580.1 hypothetical protein VPT02_004 [Vibrio phage VPT02]